MYWSLGDWPLHSIWPYGLQLPAIGSMILDIGSKAESYKPDEENNKRGMLIWDNIHVMNICEDVWESIIGIHGMRAVHMHGVSFHLARRFVWRPSWEPSRRLVRRCVWRWSGLFVSGFQTIGQHYFQIWTFHKELEQTRDHTSSRAFYQRLANNKLCKEFPRWMVNLDIPPWSSLERICDLKLPSFANVWTSQHYYTQ